MHAASIRLDFHQERMECTQRNLITRVGPSSLPSWRYGLSITRNLIKRVLTTPLVKLTQRTLAQCWSKEFWPSIVVARTSWPLVITSLNQQFSLFVLSQCFFCSPAWRLCTTWMAICKGPNPLSSFVNSCYFALYVIMFHGSSKITLPIKFVYYETISNLFHLFYLSFHILITE